MKEIDYSTMPDSFVAWWWWRITKYPDPQILLATCGFVLGVVGMALGVASLVAA